MLDPRLASFQQEADKVLQFLHNEFGKLQTGRANPAVFERIDIDAYGQKQELRAVAGISVQDGRTVIIQPWDPSILGAVEKALQLADMGAMPVNDGHVIRLTLPQLTEERRQQMTKTAQNLAEDARISLRKHRQTAHDAIKQEKDEDVRKTLQDELQKEVEKGNARIEESRKKKEEEMMKI